LALWVLIFGNAQKNKYRQKDIKRLEKRYGFTYATPMYHRVKCQMELLTLITVPQDRAFDKAGFKPGDRFKPDSDFNGIGKTVIRKIVAP
jgi:hypothetical protein